MDPRWQFCPYCGSDNRPPGAKPRIGGHFHRFYHHNYCTLCGEPQDEPYWFGYKWRIRLALLSLLGGLIAAVAFVAIWYGRGNRGTTIGKWVDGWYSTPTYRTDEVGASSTSTLGQDHLLFAGFCSISLILLGIGMLYGFKPSDSDDDRS